MNPPCEECLTHEAVTEHLWKALTAYHDSEQELLQELKKVREENNRLKEIELRYMRAGKKLLQELKKVRLENRRLILKL